jgi:signal recognition particle subunit SEC65
MALLVAAALVILSVAIVLYPFMKLRSRSRAEGREAGADFSDPDLESILESIRTLQLENQLGKVSEDDYQRQLRSYRLGAAAALRQRVDGKAGDPGWLVEQEILVARAALGAVNGAKSVCPNCSALLGAGVLDCPECGAKGDLTQVVPP